MMVNSQSVDAMEEITEELERVSEETVDKKKSMDRAVDSKKNITFEDIQEENEWTKSKKNPDYNLVLIHAANSGYVAKMQESEVGSYLTYFFAKKVKDNIVDHGRKGLAEILKDIQNLLHDKGKQQIRKEFYNDTSNLRIEINNKGMEDQQVFE